MSKEVNAAAANSGKSSDDFTFVVMDDEFMVAEVAARLLSSQEGRRPEAVKFFTDPELGLRSVLESPPDILLLDMNMPKVSGREFIRALRDKGITTEVIVITAHADLEMAIELIRNEAADLVCKPFRRGELIASVSRIERGIRMRRENANYRMRLQQSEKLSALGLLAAGIAHEINNPNTFVKGNLELLEKYGEHILPAIREAVEGSRPISEASVAKVKSFLDEYGKILQASLNGAERIRKIVGSLLPFARSASSQRTLLNPEQIIEEAVTLTSHRIKRHEVRKHVAEGLGQIYVNEQEIVQVLMNLLVNAADAIEERSAAGSGLIEIGLEARDGRVEFSVRDNGTGISDKAVSKIFDPFFTTKPQGKGTGLGLSVSKGYVEGNGGSLEASSVPGGGAKFSFGFPVHAKRGEAA